MIRFVLVLLCLGATSAWAERLVLVSDLNGRYGSTGYHARVESAVDTIIDRRPTLVLSAGDMVAGQSPQGLDDPVLESMWQAFTNVFLSPLDAAKIPVAVTAGNHDASAYPGFERDRAAFARHWSGRPPPGLAPGSEWPWRYALVRDGLLAITFDGTLPGRVPAAERGFVERMLREHGAAAEWTVVWSHLPFWPLAQNRETEIIEDPEFLSLLHDAGVDAYVSGHHHLFYAGLDEAGMLHVSVGALGGNARRFSTGGARQPHGFAELERRGTAVKVNAFSAPGFAGPGEAVLPRRIPGPGGELVRLEGTAALRSPESDWVTGSRPEEVEHAVAR
jgi:hypothetical protein